MQTNSRDGRGGEALGFWGIAAYDHRIFTRPGICSAMQFNQCSNKEVLERISRLASDTGPDQLDDAKRPGA